MRAASTFVHEETLLSYASRNLSVCLPVCLFRVNTKTTEPIGLKFCTKIDHEAGQHIGLFAFLKPIWATIRGRGKFQCSHFNTQRLKFNHLWIIQFDSL